MNISILISTMLPNPSWMNIVYLIFLPRESSIFAVAISLQWKLFKTQQLLGDAPLGRCLLKCRQCSCWVTTVHVKRAKMLKPAAAGQHRAPIEKEEEIERAAPGTQTAGQMAVRVHMGRRVCPSLPPALCIYMNVRYPACACVKLRDLMYHMCTYGLCILCIQIDLSFCVCPCVKGINYFFFLYNSLALTITGQTDPQHERLVCRRRAKNTVLLTSVGQRRYADTHGPPTWHSSI